MVRGLELAVCGILVLGAKAAVAVEEFGPFPWVL
jgi:hypothetical protein